MMKIKQINSLISCHHRRGFTLTELAIVLLAAGVLIGGIWVVAQQVWENYYTYRAGQQITSVVQNIRDYYAGAAYLPVGAGSPGNFKPSSATGTDITALVDGFSLLPVEMRRDPAHPGATAIDNPFDSNPLDNGGYGTADGTFHVFSITHTGSPPYNYLRIRMLGLTSAACLKLILQQPLDFDQIGVTHLSVFNGSGIGTTINASNITIKTGGICAYDSAAPGCVLPLAPATVNGWCTGGGSSIYQVEWEYRFRP